jgi:secreted PhoX family phosphatase
MVGTPDNCAIDALGRLWVATDGNRLQTDATAYGLETAVAAPLNYFSVFQWGRDAGLFHT